MSLHEGLAPGWWGWRLAIGDAEGAEHGGGALSAGRDGTLGGAVAEIDINDADGFERAQRFGGGEIEARGLELLFDRAMEQEGEGGDEDVGLHPRVGSVIDRPQVNHVFEIGEGAFDFGQFLVELHGLDGADWALRSG